eukprot:SAG31_NODE_164_length_21790_cov_26.291411_7_plen_144_part_00
MGEILLREAFSMSVTNGRSGFGHGNKVVPLWLRHMETGGLPGALARDTAVRQHMLRQHMLAIAANDDDETSSDDGHKSLRAGSCMRSHDADCFAGANKEHMSSVRLMRRKPILFTSFISGHCHCSKPSHQPPNMFNRHFCRLL